MADVHRLPTEWFGPGLALLAFIVPLGVAIGWGVAEQRVLARIVPVQHELATCEARLHAVEDACVEPR